MPTDQSVKMALNGSLEKILAKTSIGMGVAISSVEKSASGRTTRSSAGRPFSSEKTSLRKFVVLAILIYQWILRTL